MRRFFALTLSLLVLVAGGTAFAQAKDLTPRIAVMTAFPPEIIALSAKMQDRQETIINGVIFTTGTLGGKPVVLFMSGVSMVNAAMNTQLVLDRFTIPKIVFSGVAGGVDPNLDVGDVIVAEQWGQYLEAGMARETPTGFEPALDRERAKQFVNFGMIFPNTVGIARGKAPVERRFWFQADPAMLAVAREVAAKTKLARCHDNLCLLKDPKVVVGGNGVSGMAFVDNKALREWAYSTFQARVLDMETAAVGHVAYANGVPFIAFRSLSDLAGGDPGQNQARAFYPLASENSAVVVLAFLAALP
jgi:adenosylhomocysteine nucleosidase